MNIGSSPSNKGKAGGSGSVLKTPYREISNPLEVEQNEEMNSGEADSNPYFGLGSGAFQFSAGRKVQNMG